MTVCLSFLQTEMDKEQQIDMAETNQPPRTTMTIQRDAAGNNSTWLAPAWNGFLNAVKSVLKWLYIGIEWPKDINSDAFARRAPSYCIGFYLSGRRRKFGFNVHITINTG